MLYDRVLSSIAERVIQAAADRGRSLGSPFSLLKQFEVYDDGYGAATVRAFENTLGACAVYCARVYVCMCLCMCVCRVYGCECMGVYV